MGEWPGPVTPVIIAGNFAGGEAPSKEVHFRREQFLPRLVADQFPGQAPGRRDAAHADLRGAGGRNAEQHRPERHRIGSGLLLCRRSRTVGFQSGGSGFQLRFELDRKASRSGDRLPARAANLRPSPPRYNSTECTGSPCFWPLSVSLFAQKKPVTLETLNQGGRGGRGGGGAANWAPDGKTFVFRQRQSLMIYNPATKTSRELVSTEAIDAAAVKPPAETGAVRLDQSPRPRFRRHPVVRRRESDPLRILRRPVPDSRRYRQMGPDHQDP